MERPPIQESDISMPDSLYGETLVEERIDTGPSEEADHVVTLLEDESGFRQFLDLGRDETQEYANILDAVRYFTIR